MKCLESKQRNFDGNDQQISFLLEIQFMSHCAAISQNIKHNLSTHRVQHYKFSLVLTPH